MGLFKGTKEQYHGFNSFTATANQTNFTLDYPTLPSSSAEFNVFLTGTVGSVTKTQRTLASAFSVAITSYTARWYNKQLYSSIHWWRQVNKQSKKNWRCFLC